MCEKICKNCAYWDGVTEYDPLMDKDKGMCSMLEGNIQTSIGTRPIGTPSRVDYYFTKYNFGCDYFASNGVFKSKAEIQKKSLEIGEVCRDIFRLSRNTKNQAVYDEFKGIIQKINTFRDWIEK